MPTITEFAADAQNQILKSVDETQKVVLEAVATWAKSVEQLTPALPALPALPLADSLPKPEELIESSFQFAEKLLAAHHTFTRNLLAVVSPVIDAKVAAPAAAPAAAAGRAKETASV